MPRAVRAPPGVLAAVDLGSNSFHMVVARYVHGQLVVIDRLREMVRLGGGVDAEGRLDPAVAARALACLERFGQRLRAMRARNVRVVGTSALRTARRKQQFLANARSALGHPIQIISGMEEARLIYSGVAHMLPPDRGRRLVIDIGGGSTEVVIGEGYEAQELASLHVGCVSLTQRFFADGRISAKRIQRARLAAQVELEPIQQAFLRRGWDQAFGSSGTVRAILESLRELEPNTRAITARGLSRLLSLLEEAGHIRALRLVAVTDERRAVFPAGVAILMELLKGLDIEALRLSEGALRDGLLYDMVGRLTDADPRERSVRSMQRRYHVELEQAQRVERTALELLRQVRTTWALQDPLAVLTLKWAARLHEIGLDVAHSGYHRHGAYLLQNADMPGFTREEQRLLAQVAGAHRRKLALEDVGQLIPPWDRLAVRLIVLLRLAVLLHRSRSSVPIPALRLSARAGTLTLRIGARWLASHPLSLEDLRQEVEYLRAAGLRLRIYAGSRPALA
jgi:exopolyphosphatase/guanosine-5'-triphosphate,3'-diphosphate pyrophosphatase